MSDFQDREFYQDLANISSKVFSNDISAGLESCQTALQKYPESGKVMCLLGVAANLLGDQGQATQLLEKAYDMEPESLEIANANAVVLARCGKLNDSLFFAKLATTLEKDEIFSQMLPADLSDYAKALQNVSTPMHGIFAMIEFEHGNFVEAIEACERQLKTNARDWDAHVLMAQSLTCLNAPQRAIGALQGVLAATDQPPLSTWTALGDAYLTMGERELAWASYQEALEKAVTATEKRTQQVHLLAQQNVFGSRYAADFKAVYDSYLTSVEEEAEVLDLFGGGEDLEGRKIRVGFLSDQFNDSTFMPFFEMLFREYDRDAFEFYGYQKNAIADTSTSRLKSMIDGWREIEPIDPDTAAFMMSSDGLDILVDTIGLGGNNVADIIAQKPAPVIINWLAKGAGVTTGAVDFVLANETTKSRVECLNGSALPLLLEGPYVGFDGDALSVLLQRSTDCPRTQNGFMTFGALLTPQYMSAALIRQWAMILLKDPSAALVLAVSGLGESSYRNWVVERFAMYGVLSQIQFVKLNDSDFETMSQLLMGIDIFLAGSAPQNLKVGIAALLSGVPVLSLKSETLETCLMDEILTGMGRTSWVVEPGEDMSAIVTGLITDEEILASLREDLSEELLDSTVCDEEEFVEAFEDALRESLKLKKLM